MTGTRNTMKTLGALMLGALMLGALMLGGCTSYDDRFETMMAERPSAYTDITGVWLGEWVSEGSGHSGPMKAIVTNMGEGLYLAEYQAEWGPGVEFEQEVTLKEVPGEEAGYQYFVGSEDLGWMWGGVYQYKAKATPTQFNSTYRAEDDHGIYTLRRP